MKKTELRAHDFRHIFRFTLLNLVSEMFIFTLLIFSYQASFAQSSLLFDGSKVSSWGKQVTTSCGSSLKDVSVVPSGKTGTSTEAFIKDGCSWASDYDANGVTNKERAELSGKDRIEFAEGTVWYIDFWQKFEQLASTHSGSDWDIWMQTHFINAPDSQPNLIFATDGANKMIFKTSSGDSHTKQWTGPIIQPSTWYRVTLGVKFSSSSNTGWIELYKDGQLVLSKKSLATLSGTYVNGYLKKGIYRNASISGDQKYLTYGLSVSSSSPFGSASSNSNTNNSSNSSTTSSSTHSSSTTTATNSNSSQQTVVIPSDAKVQEDGTVLADFNGDNISDIARDTNKDNMIDINNEILMDGAQLNLTNSDSKPPFLDTDYKEDNKNTQEKSEARLDQDKLKQQKAIVLYVWFGFIGLGILSMFTYIVLSKKELILETIHKFKG